MDLNIKPLERSWLISLAETTQKVPNMRDSDRHFRISTALTEL